MNFAEKGLNFMIRIKQLVALTFMISAFTLSGCGKKVDDDTFNKAQAEKTEVKATEATIFEGERHFANLKQLTFGGQNAEAYFSADGSKLSFQSTRNALECDAIFTMNADGSNVTLVSSGKGVTTCSFISPDGQSIIYASTHLGGLECPARPDMSRGYVWGLYPGYDIFKADADGRNIERLTDSYGYDAEGVYSPDGSKILFTSLRSGDLELWMMNPDGTSPEQLTNEPGYDGGGFFSYDGDWIVWRASRPKGEELKEYKELLRQNLVRPSKLDLYIMKLSDKKVTQLTNNGAANFAPYFHPAGDKIIYASNVADPQGRNFDLYLIEIATKTIERITFNETFDAFPMFSHDGKKLVFASNRNGVERGETNIFIADWID
jgi:Tol biopolymer transport system component